MLNTRIYRIGRKSLKHHRKRTLQVRKRKPRKSLNLKRKKDQKRLQQTRNPRKFKQRVAVPKERAAGPEGEEGMEVFEIPVNKDDFSLGALDNHMDGGLKHLYKNISSPLLGLLGLRPSRKIPKELSEFFKQQFIGGKFVHNDIAKLLTPGTAKYKDFMSKPVGEQYSILFNGDP